jgi:hypothetical protein
MKPLIIRRLARADVRSARGRYEREQAGLGFEFAARLDGLMARIRALPLQFPEVRPRVRRALLRKFPFAVYFVITQSRTPAVIAVLHQRQDSAELERRVGLEAD